MSEDQQPYIDMNDKDALEQAKGNIDSYDGVMSAGASHRSYLDIEDNISVRTAYRKSDYYQFREGERPPTEHKQIINKCMNAYDKVGIIKNVIDLMGDFGSQGISLVHVDKNAQRFYRRWWQEVNGSERSERFLNTLFRCGNVVIKRRYAKLTKTVQKQMTRGETDFPLPKEKVNRRRIPWIYDFLNPLTVDIIGDSAALFTGDKKYRLKISNKTQRLFKENNQSFNKLPSDVKKALKDGTNYIDLDPETLMVYHYKKDDWQTWANPMVNAILDDITMMEKMKLADMSALDGAISNIRLWRLGDLEHKILPTKSAINKLRNILASNVGGGTMDLVWGPEIDFKESNTQIYKFLGTEKYEPVLNSIYAGLGIPPTLTGIAGQSGGFTNNFISLKTLIERLEYGRDLLTQFWTDEIRKVQKAMGFAAPAQIHFDHMILSDDSSEKNLLIQLADRDIVSMETLRERFGEIDDLEKTRINTERKSRKSDRVPPKAGPYHNSQIEDDYKKIALNKDQISIDQVTKLKPKPTPPQEEQVGPPQNKKPNQSENPDGGRPKNANDQQKRKQKVVNPRNKPGVATTLIWATSAQKQISTMITPALLAHYGKANLRTLTKKQSEEMELSKFVILANVEPFSEITNESILNVLESKRSVGKDIMLEVEALVKNFVDQNSKNPSVEEIRQIYCLAYSSLKSPLQ